MNEQRIYICAITRLIADSCARGSLLRAFSGGGLNARIVEFYRPAVIEKWGIGGGGLILTRRYDVQERGVVRVERKSGRWGLVSVVKIVGTGVVWFKYYNNKCSRYMKLIYR